MSETAKLSWHPATGGVGHHTNYARGKLAPGIPKSNFWASDPNGINQVGSQGFEFDYVGVIFGRDLVYEDGWRGNRKIVKKQRRFPK